MESVGKIRQVAGLAGEVSAALAQDASPDVEVPRELLEDAWRTLVQCNRILRACRVAFMRGGKDSVTFLTEMDNLLGTDGR